MFVLVTLLFFGLIVRLVFLQVVDSRGLQEMAADQWTRSLSVSARRGEILDRGGTVLAQSASAKTVVVRPGQIDPGDVDRVCDTLCEILSMDRETVEARVTKDASEVWLKRQITQEQAEAIDRADLPGVVFTEDSKRYYPYENFMTQVLGFTTIDGEGQEGLEAQLDKYLAGDDGQIITETDATGQELSYSVSRYVAAQDGYDVQLSIDYVIQSIAESAAEDALVKYNAKGVRCIVMDPATSEILAMVNKPDYDLNAPPRNDGELLRSLSRNSCVVDVYEPGSTFKIITTAGALELGVTNVDAAFNCAGAVMVDGERIKCWRSYNPHGLQTLSEAVAHSCNPAFVKLALDMGREDFYGVIRDFGFGSSTGSGMTGEAAGILLGEKYVRNVDLARIGFGQSIAVTPLQLINAVCAVANGGELHRPVLIQKITDGEGGIIEENVPQTVRQVISPETSQTMREILEAAITESSGAYLPGYHVAGKTGTAQKYGEDGKIMRDVHIASFVGFAPANDPKIAVLFIVDEAKDVDSDFGGVLAAPYAGNIIRPVLEYLKVAPDAAQKADERIAVPDFFGMTKEEAIMVAEERGLAPAFKGEGEQVILQDVPPETKVNPGTEIVFTMETAEDPVADGMTQVPDVSGMTVIEANIALTSANLRLIPAGSGRAVAQSESAGAVVPAGTRITVEFQ